MNLGRELVALALREKNLKPFMNAGINDDFMSSASSAAIFTEHDGSAYKYLLSHWATHKKTPSIDMFRLTFPEGSYRLPKTDYSVDELLELFDEDYRRYESEIAAMDIADAVEAGNYDGAVDVMLSQAKKIRNARVSKDIHLRWDSMEYDYENRIAREIFEGVFTGIPEIDESFAGFQPGNLITYLGRAKAGKTSFLLMSALAAWRSDKRVLFLTVEITADGVADRLDAFGASISYADYTRGELTHPDKEALRAFRREMEGTDEGFVVVQPQSKYTLTDLEYDIDRYEPDVVFVDGFYFLIDRNTGKSGGSWEGHDNLARELKELALRHNLCMLTTMQVREKQLSGKKGKGIDDGAIMGGTGLIMASDMVLGFDADDQAVHTISCTRSRTGYLRTVRGIWNWNRCSFTVTEIPGGGMTNTPTPNQSKFAYAGASND
jgi:archaellum biogenesis ATPase FlaH